MTSRLFVYGTLRQDVPNSKFARLFESDAALVGSGRTKGRLFDLGRYPGFVDVEERGRSSWVRGQVYELAQPEDTLARLDAYEGCGADDPRPHPYERVEREVHLDDGRRLAAWVYVYRRDVAGRSEIASGDYRM